MTGEHETWKSWAAQSPEHAAKAMRALRHSLNKARDTAAFCDQEVARNLSNLNEVKAVFYEQGWELPE